MKLGEPKLSILNLADELKISYEYARRIIRGINVPDESIVRRAAIYFQVDPENFKRIAHQDRLGR
jgi:transcriptional regulator with XRE-family HTH domain